MKTNQMTREEEIKKCKQLRKIENKKARRAAEAKLRSLRGQI